jgi:hypothetical protein
VQAFATVFTPIHPLPVLWGAGPAGGLAAAGPAAQAPAQALRQARVVQIAGVQLSKRKLAEAEILAIPGLPGLPDLLGDQLLRLLIGGNNPSEHAWRACQALRSGAGMVTGTWGRHGHGHMGQRIPAVSLQVQGFVAAVVNTSLWTQVQKNAQCALKGISRPGSTQAGGPAARLVTQAACPGASPIPSP